MDKYIRDLTVCNANLEDAVGPCFKILQFLKISRHNELSYTDVEAIIKASIYLKESFVIFGSKLVLKLQEHCKYYAQDKYYQQCLDALTTDICEFTLRLIFDTPNGYKHMLNVDTIFGQLRKANADYKLNIKSDTTTCLSVGKDRERLLLILQRLFQIPVAQIDTAIEQIIETVPFDIVAYTFSDLERHMYADLCAIFEQKICDRLEHNKISSFFVNSMYYSASHSDSGRQLYWKCLKSRAFENSLCKFFVMYLKTIAPVRNEDHEFHCTTVEYQMYNFTHITYLIHTALHMKSPCRTKLYKTIYEHNIDPLVVNYLNKLIFVYD